MSDTDQGADTIISDEELELELEPTTENVAELKEKLKKANEAKQQLFARAKKAEGFEKQDDGTWIKKAKTETPKPEPIKSNEKASDQEDERLELRLDGYSKDEVSFIMNNGGRKALEDKTSYVSIALNTKREQQKAEEAASKTPDVSSLSEVERKYTEEQLKNMSSKELAKILPRT